MWDFEHRPRNVELAEKYAIHMTQPAKCADELLAERADLGLIPVASLTESLGVVPGCAIASLNKVRSIQLIVKLRGFPASDVDETLRQVCTVAVDSASRSSAVHTQILYEKFIGVRPQFISRRADAVSMLHDADAALLIGDPALLALEDTGAVERVHGPCLWLDLAEQWIARTGMPWVAAVWAVRPEALGLAGMTPQQLISDLQASRDAGLANVESLVEEWAARIQVPADVIRHYLTKNIYYYLTPECVESIRAFRAYAAELSILPATQLRLL